MKEGKEKAGLEIRRRGNALSDRCLDAFSRVDRYLASYGAISKGFSGIIGLRPTKKACRYCQSRWRGISGNPGRAARAILSAIFGILAFGPGDGVLAAEPCIDEEPNAYRTENYRSAVPCSLSGVRTVSTEEMRRLVEGASPPLLIDVLPSPRRPQGMNDDALWFPPERTTIVGSVWLPNIGYGLLPIVEENYFKDNIERLSAGDVARQMVFFCLEDCWMGWNAARRAYRWGYGQVIWYPDGTDGWAREGLPMESMTPVPSDQGQ